jgi:hypothetical protein
MNFKSVMDTAVYSKLGSSSALVTALGGSAFYKNQAPDGKALPYVVWNWQSAVDENQTPSRMWNTIINIRCFAASATQAGSVDAIIDELFTGTAFTVTGFTNFWTAREMEFDNTIIEPDKSRTEVVGGLYRIRIGQ